MFVKPFMLALVCLASSMSSAAPFRSQKTSLPVPPSQAKDSKAGSANDKDKIESKEAGNKDKDSDEPKPYDTVITADAKTTTGIIAIHRVKQKWYFEIPSAEYGKDFLWVTRLAGAPNRIDRGGANYVNLTVCWERRENRILLRRIDYSIVSDPSQPLARGVQESNVSAIIMTFPVEAVGKDDAAVIDVSKLFNTDVNEVSGKQLVGANSIDANRSFIDYMHAYPKNIEIETTSTYNGGGGESATSEADKSESSKSTAGKSVTAIVHYSMIELPSKPMAPRLYDDRVGFFYQKLFDYGMSDPRAVKRFYITRWRMEKKDPSAVVSDPVKPIVFYIDPATPSKWIPYIKAGVESWQPAFEKSGFHHAILSHEAPTKEQDPDWNAEDVRYSMIRWLPSELANAQGNNIHDPRSGEILNAPISIYNNVLDLVRTWYFLQASPLDPEGRTIPLPDTLMGKLIQYVVAHEVGHTLGLEHNFIASAMYPTAKLRDPAWVKKMGHTPSIMDYARFNYVAQPEDHIDPADLIPKVGPYDEFAIHWGYAPIANAPTPATELPTLDLWARAQDTTPWLRYSYPDAMHFDPRVEAETVGDQDPILAATLGIKNLHRVMNYLVPATTSVPGESYRELLMMWMQLQDQWQREIGAVSKVVGGVEMDNKHVGQPGEVWTAVSADQQRAAIHFVIENVFKTRPFFLQANLLHLFQPNIEGETYVQNQESMLQNLMAGGLLARLEEQELQLGSKAYTAQNLLDDLRHGLFSDLSSSSGPLKLDFNERNVQISYIKNLNFLLNRAPDTAWPNLGFASNDEYTTPWINPLYRGELHKLQKLVAAAVPRAADEPTRLHLDYIRTQIERALDDKYVFQPERSLPVGTYPWPYSLRDACNDSAWCLDSAVRGSK